MWQRVVGVIAFGCLFSQIGWAAPKVHVISFGRWNSVPWSPGTTDAKPLMLKMRALIVDGRVKEYVVGMAHDVTDRLFVVRRAFRVNDALPDDPAAHWQWQRGGWLVVNRLTGRLSALSLPEFDALYSAASWYRDYVAYCGVSDDGKKISAVVAQLSRRKPVLKKALSEDGIAEGAAPDSACAAPNWSRGPARVTFEVGKERQTFSIRGHVVDLMSEADDDDEGTK